MSKVNSKKDLDTLQMFMRKGKLGVNPKSLRIHVRLIAAVPNPSYKEEDRYSCPKIYTINLTRSEKAPQFKLYRSYYNVMTPEASDKFWADVSTTKYRLSPSYNGAFGLGVSKKHGAFTCELVSARRGAQDITDPQTGVVTGSKEVTIWDERSDINLDKTLPFSFRQEAEEEKTLLEWWKFARKIRRHVRDYINKGGLRGCMNKCDYLKEHKNHEEFMTALKENLDQYAASIAAFKEVCTQDLEDLSHLVGVHPYNEIRYNLQNAVNYIDNASRCVKQAKERTEKAQ